jgi:hypothetical protein
MRVRAMMAGSAFFILSTTFARAQLPDTDLTLQPLSLSPTPSSILPPSSSPPALLDDQSVYAPPAPPRENEGFNAGGVNFDLQFRYVTDNVYRGVSRSGPGEHAHSTNLQFDGKLDFNLGKLPHPFIGSFVNIHSADPVSRFQEVRPYFGFNWNLRPFTAEIGNITYIFPERDNLNTGEVYAKITFDDSWLLRTDTPIVSPYVLAAYDYDKYNGWYFEAGIKHDFVFQESGFTLTALADVGFVANNVSFSTKLNGNDTGLQHYEIGLVGHYSLNHLFKFSPRYGTFTLEGYLFYDDRTSTDLKATIQVWGGAGIGFSY